MSLESTNAPAVDAQENGLPGPGEPGAALVFLDEAQVKGLLERSLTAAARLEALAVRMEAEVEALSRDLRAEVLLARAGEIRAAHGAEMERETGVLLENARLAAAQKVFWTHRQALSRAVFQADAAAEAAVRLCWMERTARLDAVKGLLPLARWAAARGDAALAGVIAEELDGRRDESLDRETRRELENLLSRVPSPAAWVTAWLDRIILAGRRAGTGAGTGPEGVERIALGLLAGEMGA